MQFKRIRPRAGVPVADGAVYRVNRSVAAARPANYGQQNGAARRQPRRIESQGYSKPDLRLEQMGYAHDPNQTTEILDPTVTQMNLPIDIRQHGID
ncbi:putative DNA-directed DNA polymerase [Pseudomonas sp. StFLB209]|nr:putative DNA-directed DNA polymerase [Pseudomonas sp. StFLB209]